MKMLVTGGAGFIGSNFINYWLSRHKDDTIVNVDKITYAANPDHVKHEQFDRRYRLVKGDVTDSDLVDLLVRESDCVVNFAAESHVDNSIASPRPFLSSNYMGVFTILEAVRKYGIRFHQISTDEVFGSLPADSRIFFNERTAYSPRNPYSASKAAADLLVRAYVNTYGIKATISNCSNNFGQNQHIEKLIPKTIMLASRDQKIPLYGNGNQIRDWIYVEDHCSAIERILLKGNMGETYLVSARNELRNVDVVKMILSIMGKSDSLIEYVDDRPGHDVRYAIDPRKIETELRWKPKFDFDKALELTVRHYTANKR